MSRLGCPDENQLAEWARGDATRDRIGALEAHIADCDDCRRLVFVLTPSEAEVAVTSPALTSAGGPAETIGRFEVRAELGRGGMGVVYRAFDPTLEREVALKVLPAASIGRSGQERLLREARSLARLSHLNVVAVHEAGSIGDQVFIAMELVAGTPLDRWLEQARSREAILGVFAAAARGLAAVHEARLVHRDVKPSNIIVAGDRVVVIDFGLARVGPQTAGGGDGEVSALTETGAFIGTPAYASPEQLAGDAATAASDVFSFSVSLWQALAGARPFSATSRAELVAAISDGPPKGSRRWPAPLRRLLERGLAFDAGERSESMAAIAATLGRLRHRRRRAAIAGGGIAALGIAGIVLAAMWPGSEAPCQSAARIDPVWNPLIRAELASTLAPRSPVAVRQTIETIDEKTRRWVDARDAACLATSRGEQSAALLDTRMACFGRQLAAIDAAIDLAGGDRALELAAALPGPERCAPERMSENPLPDDPARRQAIAAAGQARARLEAHLIAGRMREAAAVAETLGRAAGELDYPPVVAEIQLSRSRAARQVGDLDGAIRSLKEAGWAAAASRDPELEAGAAAELALALADDRADLDGAADRIAHARALLGRLGAGAAASVHLDIAQALVSARRLEEAEAELEAARSADRRAGERGVAAEFRRARIANTAAVIAEARLDPARALEHHREALAAIERIAGEHHPAIADSLEGMWRAARMLERDDDEARGWLRRAGAIRERIAGPENEFLERYLAGMAGSDRGDRRRALEQAVAIGKTIYGEHHGDVANALAQLALVLAESKDPRAVDRALEADAMVIALHGPRSRERATALTARIEARTATGDLEGAVTAARELAGLFSRPSDPERISAYSLLAATLSEIGAWREARDAARQALSGWDDSNVLGDIPRIGLEMLIARADHEIDRDPGAIVRARALRSELAGHRLDDYDRQALADWDRWLASVDPSR